MKCLFLAAGYATRLYPLTENFPKPLLDVAGRSILDRLIDDLDATGRIDDYAVVTNHKFAGHFSEWAAAYGGRVQVVDDGTSTNETRLGAVRDIKYAVDALGLDDDLLVLAGDNLLSFSLASFLDYAAAKGTSCIMRYYEPSVRRLRKSGVVKIARDGRVLSMEEKPLAPQSHWCCPPFYFYKKADLARLDEALAAGCGVDAPGSLAAWIASVSPVYAMKMPGPRYDIGTLDSYRAVCALFEAK
jgi:glucose-1-phosphate thymidylyltransferase